MAILLPAAVTAYVILLFILALFAKNKVKNETDFLAAGRRLSTFFASLTLFATWFGAGTLLTATDAIYNEGLKVTALEPFGAGSCLLIAGLFFASPLWKMKILTIPDLFGAKFGSKAEFLSALLLVPGYFGWIAVQIVALSGILHLFFSIPLLICMMLVTSLACVLACLGGMWSLSVTDAAQMIFVAVMIFVLAYVVIKALGNGSIDLGFLELLKQGSFPPHSGQIEDIDMNKFFSYINVFAIAALGNLPGQDLAQRIFSAKSAKIAKRSCIIAGFLYLFLGSISIILGLSAKSLLPAGITHSIIPHLAKLLLSPVLTTLLVLAIISIIISTMDSALLATASIIAHNLVRPHIKDPEKSIVAICRICVVLVAIASLLLALVGENAYALLEQSYSISLCGLFIPFLLGVYIKRGHQGAAISSMLLGTGVWVLGFYNDSFIMMELVALFASLIAYFVIAKFYSKEVAVNLHHSTL